MDFLINENELAALCGLPHIQQLAYLRGIRPYMDVKTGIVGIKRGISYQSIAEQLYVEPHQGIKSISYSRPQLRRALSSLEREGLITLQSQGLQLILKCELATRGYSVQNKADTNPSHQAVLSKNANTLENTAFYSTKLQIADIGEIAKADTPLKDNNYIYLLAKFEKFWALYPEKKSKNSSLEIFQQLNPDENLFSEMLNALQIQITHYEAIKLSGSWVPPWKYPANWLAKRCWEDEITIEAKKESTNAHRKNVGNKQSKDMFSPEECGAECQDAFANNILQFHQYKN